MFADVRAALDIVKKVMWEIARTLLAATLLCSRLEAGNEGGGTTSPFTLGAGSRTLAMGGTAAAVWGDSYAMLWNPAGLFQVDRNEVNLFHTSLFDESTTYSSIIVAHPFVELGVLSFGATQLRVGGIERRDAENRLLDDDLKNIQTRYTIGYARDIVKGFTIGTSFKLDRYAEGEYTANGFGIDAGIGLEPSVHSPVFDGMAIGLSFANILEPRVRLVGQEAGDPRALRAGGSLWRSISRSLNDRLTVAADVDRARYSETRFHAGTEYSVRDVFALRAGWDAGIPTFGCGFRLPFLLFDYAYRSTELGGNHLFSLTCRFGASRTEKAELARKRRDEELRKELDAQINTYENEFITKSLESGRENLAKENYAAAIEYFNRVLLWSPSDEQAKLGVRVARASVLMLRGDTLMTQGRLAEALLSYREASAEQPSPLVAERIKRCEDRIQETTDNDRMGRDILQRSIELYAERNWAGAATGFQEVLALDPSNELAREYLSKSRGKIHEVYERNLAEADRLAAAGRFGAALQMLRAELENNPGDARIEAKIRELDVLRKVAEARTRSEEGSRAAERAIGAQEREELRRSYDRGVELFKRSDFAQAIAEWEGVWRAYHRFEQVSEYLVKAYQYLGMEQYARHDYEGALDTWNKILTVDPDNEKAIRYIGKTREELSKLEGFTTR